MQQFQYHIHIPQQPRPYIKPLLPYRRIPWLPPYSQIDRTVMETDWETVYRSWKEGLGWRNRVRMFVRCESWLGDLQDTIWSGREWGRTANYVILPPGEENENLIPVVGNENNGPVIPVIQPVTWQGAEDEEMLEPVSNGTIVDLEQFQWP
jgi:hypothetical protein